MASLLLQLAKAFSSHVLWQSSFFKCHVPSAQLLLRFHQLNAQRLCSFVRRLPRVAIVRQDSSDDLLASFDAEQRLCKMAKHSRVEKVHSNSLTSACRLARATEQSAVVVAVR